jgi:ribonuclease-3
VSELTAFQDRLGCRFHDENLLRLALTHPSKAHENNAATRHNQRLEFLGDAVLGLVLSRELYERFAEADEGLLTQSRAKLVNRHSLATHGRTLDLGRHLILSRGEENTGGRERASALADAFEALLGAIFLDQGLDTVRAFILREFAGEFSLLTSPAGIENPKGELQELLQARSPRAPEYQLIAASGADHDRDFECAVWHDGVELARGRGKTKKAARERCGACSVEKITGRPAVADFR